MGKGGLLRFTASSWAAIDILATCSLLAYALVPQTAEPGAMFAVVLNTIFGTLKWFITIALISQGKRDGYFYAITVFVIMLFPRSIARVLLVATGEIVQIPETALIASLFAALVVATLIMGSGLLSLVAQNAATDSGDREEKGVPSSTFDRLFMLQDDSATLTEYRSATLRHNAEEIGRAFGLSNREVDVLALYASGVTQKRIGEELDLAPSTVHSYIKSLYSKTGFHSRQDILDYMRDFAS